MKHDLRVIRTGDFHAENYRNSWKPKVVFREDGTLVVTYRAEGEDRVTVYAAGQWASVDTGIAKP